MFDIAYASTTGTTGAGTGMGSTIMMIVLMIAIFYFLMIRRFKHTKKESPVYKIITVVLTVCGVIYTFMGAVGLLSLAGIL